MPNQLPFPIPETLPRKITPCPILEAVMEVRFVPARPWDHFPGLFAEKFGRTYPKEEDTGVAQIPQVFRDKDPSLLHAAYRRLVGDRFTIQLGPRMLNLVTKQRDYPGWPVFWKAMGEVIEAMRELKISRETVRVGLRYTNFFALDVFQQLTLNLAVGNTPVNLAETGMNTVFHHGGFRNFVQINNASLVAGPDNKPVLGSILDIDTTSMAPVSDIFAEAEDLFARAHETEKGIFFGLLKGEYVATLSPEN